MRTILLVCDRCGSRSEVTQVVTLQLPRAERPIDLCPTCEELFKAWLIPQFTPLKKERCAHPGCKSIDFVSTLFCAQHEPAPA